MNSIRPILFTFFLALVSLQAMAYTVSVKGFVFDEKGNAVGQQVVLLKTTGTAPSPGYMNEVTTNADGFFSDEFDVPDGISGTLIVSTRSCRDIVEEKYSFSEGTPEIRSKLEICRGMVRCGVRIEVIQTSSSIGLIAEAKGIPPFTYEWSTGDTTQRIQVDSLGKYCVRIIDSIGCEAETCKDLIIKDSCDVEVVLKRDSTGIFLLADASGKMPFIYKWNTGDTTDRIYIDIDSISVKRYCVEVTDSTGCMSGECFGLGTKDSCVVKIIPRPDRLNRILSALALGQGPFTYEWSTGDTTRSIAVDSNGTYCVTITDTTGCMAEDCFTYGQIDSCEVEINSRISPAGIFLVANSSGTGPYTYEWSTGDTTRSIFASQSGEYCVKVTDVTGCMAKACKRVDLRDSCEVEIELNRDSTGVFLLAEASGQMPFTYEWSTGDTTDRIYIQLDTVTKYCVKVTDSTGCMAEDCFDIGILDSCVVKIFPRPGQRRGAILTALASGVGPFNYEWSTGDTTQSISIDSNGIYCVTVTDITGCMASDCFSYRKIDSCDVEIDIRMSPAGVFLMANPKGTGPFTYEWSTGDTSRLILVNQGGQYCVKVTDSTGCMARACKDVVLRDSCDVVIRVRRDTNGLYLMADASGQGPFTYEWNTGDTTQVIFVDSTGEYCVEVVDSVGCESEACFKYGGIADTCGVMIIQLGGPNGNILAAIAKGNAPFTYEWNTGDTTRTILVDSSGEYCVKVVDSTGCVATACFQYGQNDRCDVEIQVRRTGRGVLLVALGKGTGPFTYLWNTGDTTQIIQPTTSGDYCVTLTDANGCMATACYRYDVDSDCEVEIRVLKSGRGIYLWARPKGQGPYRYEWTTGDTTSRILVSPNDEYCVKVIDANGCVASACINFDNFGCEVKIQVKPSPGNQMVYELTAQPKGPGRPYTYQWSTGDSTQTITVDSMGIYCVTITDSTGCEAKACIKVPTDKRHTPARLGGSNDKFNGGVIALFPNPAGQEINLDLSGIQQGQEMVYMISTAYGKVVRKGQINDADVMSIPVEDLLPGHYTMTVRGDQFVQTISFFKN